MAVACQPTASERRARGLVSGHGAEHDAPAEGLEPQVPAGGRGAFGAGLPPGWLAGSAGWGLGSVVAAELCELLAQLPMEQLDFASATRKFTTDPRKSGVGSGSWRTK